MKLFFRTVLFFAASALLGAQEGWLAIIGGGDRPDAVIREIIRLAGGPGAAILIIPGASGDQLDSSLYARHDFESCGARNVKFILLEKQGVDSAQNIALVKESRAVFFTGGDQNRLTALLQDSRLLEEIRVLYRERGGVIAGTSAGAAVMSRIMITGEELLATAEKNEEGPDFDSIRKSNIKTAPGFGFISGAIVDQHFIKRKRINRLLSLVLENPQLIGIGIDEQTAIMVRANQEFTVLGEGLVMVIDARQSTPAECDKNGNLAARNVRLQLLRSGERFDLRKGEPR
jgi:cyanophycinase